MRNILRASALLISLLPIISKAQDTDRYLKAANRLVEQINAADYAGIQATFTKEMSQALPLDKSSAFFKGLTDQLGQIKKLGPAKKLPMAVLYPAQFEHGELDLQISLDEHDKIGGLYFKPHASSTPAPQKNRTDLSLPFKGRWLVFWGGDTKAQNYHHDVPNQQFAFDLIGVGEDGKTHRGEGGKNEDYYAFGREVLAPGDGTVIEVIEGVHDNKPGSMNSFSAVGNCVMIQHREDEISVLAHFKQGSTRVKAGDQVKRGQVIGFCGNSGNSSEPHLHYHLQHSPVLQDGLGIKCVFSKVNLVKDGKMETKSNYSPVKGEIIESGN